MNTRELAEELRNISYHVTSAKGKEIIVLAAEKIEQRQKLEEDFMELVVKSEDMCNYCKHNTECRGKECPKYIEGKGCWDDKRCNHDWIWSCRDFNFGTCDLLKNTPCNGCFENDNKGFEWRGNNV